MALFSSNNAGEDDAQMASSMNDMIMIFLTVFMLLTVNFAIFNKQVNGNTESDKIKYNAQVASQEFMHNQVKYGDDEDPKTLYNKTGEFMGNGEYYISEPKGVDHYKPVNINGKGGIGGDSIFVLSRKTYNDTPYDVRVVLKNDLSLLLNGSEQITLQDLQQKINNLAKDYAVYMHLYVEDGVNFPTFNNIKFVLWNQTFASRFSAETVYSLPQKNLEGNTVNGSSIFNEQNTEDSYYYYPEQQETINTVPEGTRITEDFI